MTERNYEKTAGECFGHFDQSCKNVCEYWDSCEYVTSSPNPDNANRVRNAVDYDKNSFRVAGKSNECDKIGKSDNYENLSEVLNYILSLDDNTLSLLSALVRNPNITQAEMARERGVSRQRINTALLFAVRNHPELKSIFCLTLSKITAARNRYKKQFVEGDAVQEKLF
jgi:hypothetical protein